MKDSVSVVSQLVWEGWVAPGGLGGVGRFLGLENREQNVTGTHCGS